MKPKQEGPQVRTPDDCERWQNGRCHCPLLGDRCAGVEARTRSRKLIFLPDLLGSMNTILTPVVRGMWVTCMLTVISTAPYGQYGYPTCPRPLPWYQGCAEMAEMTGPTPGPWCMERVSILVMQVLGYSGPVSNQTSQLFLNPVCRTLPRPRMPQFSWNTDLHILSSQM